MDIPFGDLVVLIIKFTFASIPAYFIMGVIMVIFWVIAAGIFGALFGGMAGLGALGS